MANDKRNSKISEWLLATTILSVAGLAVVDVFNEESVPIIVYGLIGAIGGFIDIERLFEFLRGGKK